MEIQALCDFVCVFLNSYLSCIQHEYVMTECVSPWYNRTGWLGVNHQLTYLLTLLFFFLLLLLFLLLLICLLLLPSGLFGCFSTPPTELRPEPQDLIFHIIFGSVFLFHFVSSLSGCKCWHIREMIPRLCCGFFCQAHRCEVFIGITCMHFFCIMQSRVHTPVRASSINPFTAMMSLENDRW